MEQKGKKKNWFARHKVLTVILIVVVIGGLAGALGSGDEAQKVENTSGDSAQTDSAANNENQKFKIGDVIAFDGKEVTVAEATRNWSSGNQYLTPDSGMEWVKVQVTIQNKSESRASYNTFDWKLQDSAGVIKDVDSVAFAVDGALQSGELATGGTVSGFLVFEVPQGDAGLKLQYSPSFWSDKNIEIEL